RRGVPALEGALVTVSLGAAALALGVTVTVGRLRRGAGLVTALARSSGLTRLAFVRQQMDVLGAAEEEAARLIAQPRRIARAFALGLLANLLVLAEYALLLAAFGLPSGPSHSSAVRNPGVARVTGSRSTSVKLASSWKGNSAPTGSPRRGRRPSPITRQPPGTSAARASASTASRSRARWKTFTPQTSCTLAGPTSCAAHGWFTSSAAKASGAPGHAARSVRSARRRKSATGSVTR